MARRCAFYQPFSPDFLTVAASSALEYDMTISHELYEKLVASPDFFGTVGAIDKDLQKGDMLVFNNNRNDFARADYLRNEEERKVKAVNGTAEAETAPPLPFIQPFPPLTMVVIRVLGDYLGETIERPVQLRMVGVQQPVAVDPPQQESKLPGEDKLAPEEEPGAAEAGFSPPPTDDPGSKIH